MSGTETSSLKERVGEFQYGIMYVSCPHSRFPWGRLETQKPNLMKRFIGTDTKKR